jgi:exopolysaccharide production protein ExoY
MRSTPLESVVEALPTSPDSPIAHRRTAAPNTHSRPHAKGGYRRGKHIPQAATLPENAWKRRFDLGCILISLPFLLPVMVAMVAWIKLVSRGPAIFRQVRIGRDGKPFTLYKFRTMYMNADTRRHTLHYSHLVKTNSPMVKLDLLCDPRLIPGGCLLRAAGLDELPQLLNVLRGDMSLVGPRPCLPEEYGYFTRTQRVRFRALPGLTGIWQTQGKGISTFSEMNAMDADYVRKASPMLDLAIMWKTPCAVIGQMRMAFHRRRSAHARPAVREHVGTSPTTHFASPTTRLF